MSLINQMLNDLDRRKHTAGSSPNLSIPLSKPKRDKLNLTYSKTLIASTVLGVFCCGIVLNNSFNHSHIQTKNLLNLQFSQRANTPKPITEFKSVTGKLSAIQEGEVLSIKLNFDDVFHYRVETIPTPLTLKIVLENSLLPESGLPSGLILKKEGSDSVLLIDQAKYRVAQIQVDDANSLNLELRAMNYVTNQFFKTNLISDADKHIYKSAAALVENGNHRKAIKILNRLVSEKPFFTGARELLAQLLLQNKQIKQAIKVIDIGLENESDYIPLIDLKAKTLMAEGHYQRALNLLLQYRPNIIDQPNHYALLASIHQNQGNANLAIPLYEHLLAYHSERSDWWAGLGVAYDTIGNLEQAKKAFLVADKSDDLSPALKSYIEQRLDKMQML